MNISDSKKLQSAKINVTVSGTSYDNNSFKIISRTNSNQ